MMKIARRKFTLIALPVGAMLMLLFMGKPSSAHSNPAIQEQTPAQTQTQTQTQTDSSAQPSPTASPEAQAPAAAKDSKAANMQNMPHMDHNAKHNGVFFMALDNKHHLEGVLLPGGIFRVYLYDEYTKPLKADKVKQASGTIQIGDSEDAPKIPLGPGKKKETMEAALGQGIKPPVTLTLLLHLPDNPPDAKPELFNFTFTQFTDENAPVTASSSMANMPGMHH